MNGNELDRKILEILKRREMMFRDLLKELPGEKPLSVKLALDRLEARGEVTGLVREGRFNFAVSRKIDES
jgi:hypothetical protein